VPKAKRHDHLPGAKGYFNAAVLQAGAGPLWVCEGVRRESGMKECKNAASIMGSATWPP
jgi:hypothetical protein